MDAGSADALRVVADIGDRVGGVEAELHTRLDSELGYTKRKVEQTHQLLSGRIDDEVGVLAERVEHLRQGTATIDSGLCRLDSKLDKTAGVLNSRIEEYASKLDDQIFSVTAQVDGALVVVGGRLDTLTKDVQQFVVDQMLERELCRAAQTSLNQKINAAVAKLLEDGRRSVENSGLKMRAECEQMKAWTAERLLEPEARLAEIEGKTVKELRSAMGNLETRCARAVTTPTLECLCLSCRWFAQVSRAVGSAGSLLGPPGDETPRDGDGHDRRSEGPPAAHGAGDGVRCDGVQAAEPRAWRRAARPCRRAEWCQEELPGPDRRVPPTAGGEDGGAVRGPDHARIRPSQQDQGEQCGDGQPDRPRGVLEVRPHATPDASNCVY